MSEPIIPESVSTTPSSIPEHGSEASQAQVPDSPLPRRRRRTLVAAAPRSHIPALAKFHFLGRDRSAEFSRGVNAAVAGLGQLVERLRSVERNKEGDEAAFALLTELVAATGEYQAGALAALADYVAGAAREDSLNMDAWVPLEYMWSGDNDDIPPEDCSFYAVGDVPYSVEPSLATREWFSQTSCHVRNVNGIRDSARPISRAQFEFMRWQRGAAARDAEEALEASGAST